MYYGVTINYKSLSKTNPLATFESLEADLVGSEISAALEMSASVMSFEHETRISGCVPPNIKMFNEGGVVRNDICLFV